MRRIFFDLRGNMKKNPGLIRRLASAFLGTVERRAETKTGMDEILGSNNSAAGELVNEQTAMQITAVWRSVWVLASTVATLPLNVYRRRPDGGKEIAFNHAAHRILHSVANPAKKITSATWREITMKALLLSGNAYSEVERRDDGRVSGIIPLNSKDLRVVDTSDGPVYSILSTGRVIDRNNVLHFKAFPSDDGMKGTSTITEHRDAFGLSLASEKFGGRFFGNFARPSGILMLMPGMRDEDRELMRKNWQSAFSGDNMHRIAALENVQDFKPLTINPDEAQFIETRRFQVTETARIFGIQPHMIQDLERATFTNIEHQSIDFVVHTIRPWLVRLEQEINQTVFLEEEQSEYFAEFVVDGLLRGDVQSRYNAYAVARNWGWLSVNEIRRLENLNPVEGGDEYLTPLNMTTAGMPKEEPDGTKQ